MNGSAKLNSSTDCKPHGLLNREFRDCGGSSLLAGVVASSRIPLGWCGVLRCYEEFDDSYSAHIPGVQAHELCRRVLGIEAPWFVDSVGLKLEAGDIHMHLRHYEMIDWPCPECGGACRLDTR
jgi:hypothetical protein